MNIEDIKKHFGSYQKKCDRLYQIETKIENPKAIDMTKPITLTNSYISDTMLLNYTEEKDKIISEMKQIEDLIKLIPDEQDRTFVEQKYLFGLTYEEIAEQNNCDKQTVARHINKSLKQFVDMQ